ncbi:hypothetical protein AHF37_05158 [Paragonimus kellicotti]|nr:hypothetical protein AHF37_05158 [Paragonimus kellicotti]
MKAGDEMKSGDKVKCFNIGAVKPGKATLKKIENENKKKKEEEQTQLVFKEFVATFEGDSKNRTWIKGGVVNANSEIIAEAASSRVYRPVSKIEDKQPKSENIKPENVEKKPVEKPASLAKRRNQEQKKSKLEQFKEELKLIQQQREQRHAMRQGKNVPMPTMVQSDLDLSDVGCRGRDYRNSPLGQSQHNASAGLLGAATTNPASAYGRRGQRDRRDDYPYDFDGDRTTTNLFLGNLNPKMTEQQLCEAFGRYGPLASVKIMWPRTDEERSRGRNCGFVAFMNRRDGERALENIRGKELMGFEMKLGWGKSVPIPLYPVYIPPSLLELIKPPPPSGLPLNAQPRDWLKSLRLAIKERAKMVTDGAEPDSAMPPGPDRKPFDINKLSKEELTDVLKDAVVKVVIPSDRSVLALIHRMIEFVVLQGPQFEAAIMHREQNNPQFKFLFDYQSSEHTYYRWKLWSILHGESVNNWRTDEFRMFECGPLWRPPPMNLFSGGMPEDLVEEDDYPYAPGYVPPPQARRHREGDGMFDDMYSEALAASRRCGLTEAQRGRFTQMLADLEPCRANIGDVMVWCLEHADSASDITDCVVESLSPESTILQSTGDATADIKDSITDESEIAKTSANLSISKILARLFLISDILYNSSAKVPNASYFRKCLEDRLPDMFKYVHAFYKNVEGKLKAEQLKQKVMLCFRAWEDWAIYPNDFLIKLQNIFLGLVDEVENEADLAGVPLELESIKVGASDVLDKKLTMLDSDVEVLEGQPLVQYDGDPLDVDGSPLSEGADELPIPSRSKASISGDSKPVSANTSDKSANRLFVPSKWETVDPETVESEAVTTTSRWELLVDPSLPKAMSPGLNQVYGTSTESERWKEAAGGSMVDNEDLDGQPLVGFGGLVAYDDEDAMSPVSSDPDVEPISTKTSVPVSDPSIRLKPPFTAITSTATTTISEERRNQLREIELKVLKYQDELEASRRNDSSITDDAVNKQIQRYRERLLERLNDDDQSSSVSKKQHSSRTKSKPSSKSVKDKSSPSSAYAKSLRRERSISPSGHRDYRDRSPPRSFRERDRIRRRPTSPNSPPTENRTYDSPASIRLRTPSTETVESPYRASSARSRLTASWDRDDDADQERPTFSNSAHRSEELEEGEASDEEELPIYSRQPSKRKRYGRDGDHNSSPKHARKRQRSHSPESPAVHTRLSYRSRTPSPNHKRNSIPANNGSAFRRK